MSNSDEKSKQNGLSGDPLQRLSSFKSPRDLSLGGVKPNKKVFTPNLNVTRNKNKGPSTNNRDSKKEDKNRRDRKNDRNKNFKIGPNLIKSSGVFSEGVASAERHSKRESYGRDTDSTSTLQRPTIRIKDFVKIDKESEDRKIKCAFSDAGYNEHDACEDFRHGLQIDGPIKLPMDDGGWSNVSKAAVRVKQEVIVKQEPDEDGTIILERKPLPEVKKEVFENVDLVNLLRSDKPTLILIKLPDTLPGRGGSVDDDRPRHKANNDPSTSAATPSTNEPSEDEPDPRCYLSDMEEGRIGKLMVHRSGRVTLALGDTVFEVCIGTSTAFRQEVVSLAVDDASRSANIISIGALHHKICVVPQWEEMFNDMLI